MEEESFITASGKKISPKQVFKRTMTKKSNSNNYSSSIRALNNNCKNIYSYFRNRKNTSENYNYYYFLKDKNRIPCTNHGTPCKKYRIYHCKKNFLNTCKEKSGLYESIKGGKKTKKPKKSKKTRKTRNS